MQRIVVLTEDGSSSVYVPELEESYHSKFGSVQESQHVFIQAGLGVKAVNQKSITIFEVGFGTGLNAFLTYLYAQQYNLSVNYHAIELYPLETAVYSQLNYPAILQADDQRDVFERMHEGEWDKNIFLTENFSLHKYRAGLIDFTWDEKADLVYFDAFAPKVQPELWTTEIFSKMYNCMNQGGILVTYCAKGEVKRNMRAAGFAVEALPGPKGKREMTRGIKE